MPYCERHDVQFKHGAGCIACGWAAPFTTTAVKPAVVVTEVDFSKRVGKENVVSVLAEMLEMAKAGKLVAVSIVAIDRDGFVNQRVGREKESPFANGWALLGAMQSTVIDWHHVLAGPDQMRPPPKAPGA